jgi:hypothetical protein
MILVLILGGELGWTVHRARVQRDAVAEIEGAGGGVLYKWQFRDGVPNPAGEPWAPRWLVDLVGVDYFGNAVYVIACTRKITDTILVPIGRLSRLERLDLSDSAVTDAGLVHLEGLSRLRTLDLIATDIGDAGLAHLKGLSGLRELYLNATRVGDAGLPHLHGLTGLRELYLGGSRVTDTGLLHLEGLTGLQSLTLAGTRVTDAGLVHLERLSSLQLLTIGDGGGSRGGVTDAGTTRLRQALPGVKIER